MTDKAELGMHKGLPILRQSTRVEKGARAMNQTMQVAPFDVEPGQEIVASTLYVQTKEIFENILSVDDPGKLMGYERVLVFDTIAVVPDDSARSRKAIDTMIAKIADKAEKEAAEKKGQMRLKTTDGTEIPTVEEDDAEDISTGEFGGYVSEGTRETIPGHTYNEWGEDVTDRIAQDTVGEVLGTTETLNDLSLSEEERERAAAEDFFDADAQPANV
jgi:hypothetical protein